MIGLKQILLTDENYNGGSSASHVFASICDCFAVLEQTHPLGIITPLTLEALGDYLLKRPGLCLN